MNDIWFCGDVHGDIRHLQRALASAAEKPRALILLGDLDPPKPVGDWLAPLSEHAEVWFIHGNHETDNDLLYGTLNVLVLKSLSWKPMHGYAISVWLRASTRKVPAPTVPMPIMPT